MVFVAFENLFGSPLTSTLAEHAVGFFATTLGQVRHKQAAVCACAQQHAGNHMNDVTQLWRDLTRWRYRIAQRGRQDETYLRARKARAAVQLSPVEAPSPQLPGSSLLTFL